VLQFVAVQEIQVRQLLSYSGHTVDYINLQYIAYFTLIVSIAVLQFVAKFQWVYHRASMRFLDTCVEVRCSMLPFVAIMLQVRCSKTPARKTPATMHKLPDI